MGRADVASKVQRATCVGYGALRWEGVSSVVIYKSDLHDIVMWEVTMHDETPGLLPFIRLAWH